MNLHLKNLLLTNNLYFCALLNQLIIIDMKKNLRKIGFILALGAMTMTSCSEAADAAKGAAETATDAAHGAAEATKDAAHGAADVAKDAAHGAAEAAGDVVDHAKDAAGDAVDAAKEAVTGDHKCEAGKCGDAMETATDAVEEATEEHGAH